MRLPELDGILPFSRFFFLDNIPAIYFIFDDDTIYYIGRSQWLRNRIAAFKHRRRFQSIPNAQIGWKMVPEGYHWLVKMEAEYITAYQPILNIHGK